MKVWGYPTYVNRTISDKLEARSDKCLFVGYPKETREYQFYNTLEQRFFVSKHVVFLEKEFLLREDSGSKVELSEAQVALTNASHLTEPKAIIHDYELIADSSKTQMFRRTSRIHSVLARYGFLISKQNDVLLIENDEPTTYEESLNNSESDQWLKAMKSKMDSMYTNQVWILVDPPEGIKPIGCKWIFKKKIDMEGKVITYKAKLMAKGYRQKQGVDYDKTFSLVAMLKSIRILLVIAGHYDYEIRKMDVKIAFLNGNLTEEMYITQPKGLISGSGNKVCKLQRSIYGLKQASRS